MQARLRTLREAAERGIPLFVAVAPTYPDLDDNDICNVLEAIKPLNPLTIFHEPINIRAENVARIATHARELGVSVKTDVFDDGTAWRNYAVEQLMTVQRIATELGMAEHLHLWPDKKLKAKAPFFEARREAYLKANPTVQETRHQKQLRRQADQTAYGNFLQWLAHWHNRVSEWPGKE